MIRLQQGANAQYIRPHKFLGAQATFTSGANFHDNQIYVGLYPREGRDPTGVTTRAHAHVTNEAGYAQETVSLFDNRLIASAGIRYDEFRYQVNDKVNPNEGGLEYAGRWQGKGSLAFTPPAKFRSLSTLTTAAASIASMPAAWSKGPISRALPPPISTSSAHPPTGAASLSRQTHS